MTCADDDDSAASARTQSGRFLPRVFENYTAGCWHRGRKPGRSAGELVVGCIFGPNGLPRDGRHGKENLRADQARKPAISDEVGHVVSVAWGGADAGSLATTPGSATRPGRADQRNRVVDLILEKMEHGLVSGDPDVENLIVASFLYNLRPNYCHDRRFSRLLGFNLCRAFDRICEGE